MSDAPLSQAKLEARIRFLREQIRASQAELRLLRGIGLPRPQYHCLRCGHSWLGAYPNLVPRHCPACHSPAWQTAAKAPRKKAERKPRPPTPSPIARKPWEDAAPDTLPPPPAATLPGPSLAAQFRRRIEEPQPESRISYPTYGNLPENVVETPVTDEEAMAAMSAVEGNRDEAVREMTEGLDAGIKVLMDDTERTLAIVEAELEKSGE